MADAADTTPQPWRCLGSRLRKTAYSMPGERRQVVAQPTTTPSSETIKAEVPQQQKAKANSTNGRRIGLSRLRKNVSKKRLDFTKTPPAQKPVKVNRPESSRTSPWRERRLAELKVPSTEANHAEADKVPDQTPHTVPQQMKAKANSTNGRRPGLSRLRNDASKKRLVFNETQPAKPVIVNRPKSPRISLWRERQIAELKADIETWQNGFKAALEDLQSLFEPQISNQPQVSNEPEVSKKQAVLQQLKLPLEMLRYLSED